MVPREDLFDLIAVMTREERRHFRSNAHRYGGGDGGQKYLKLYDVILEMCRRREAYNEEEVKRALAGVIPDSSFASMKRHLLELLEENLRLFHAGRNDAESIHESMREAELLHQRGLVARAARKLKDCRQRAEQMEDHHVLLRINELERRFTIELSPKKMQPAELERLQGNWSALHAIIGQENAYHALLQKVSLLVRSEFEPRSREVQAQLPALEGNPLLQPSAQPPSFRARRAYHQARAFVFHLSNKFEAEFEEYRLLICHWESNAAFIKENPRLYKLSLSNFLHAAWKLQRYELFDEIWNKASRYPPSHFEEKAEDFQTLDFFRFLFRMNQAPLDEVLMDVDRLRRGLLEYDKKVNAARKLTFLFNFCLAYFHAGRLEEARKVMQEILDLPKTEHRKDLQAFARVLDPVLDLASGHLLGLDSRLHARMEWLRAHNRLTDWERVIFRHLLQISRLDRGDTQAIAASYRAFHAELVEIQSRMRGIVGAENLLGWVQAQLAD